MSAAAAASPDGLDRRALLARLRAGPEPDVLVIGGGATGLGCAVDAASRGHSVVLLEGHDFAKATSSRATKLIHGGIRYLAQGRMHLVREALLERTRLLANAPHLVRPLRFVVPAYHRFDRFKYATGLKLYELLAGMHGIGPSQVLNPAAAAGIMPTLERRGLRGGVAYWDAQFDDARLAIALMRTVLAYGGLAINYLGVDDLLIESGRIVGVHARDFESGERFVVRARAVINATGVWSDRIRAIESPRSAPRLRPSRGVHVVVAPRFLPGEHALLVPRTADGRVLFGIPWQGRVILGTTDAACDDTPLEPVPLPEEVDQVLAGLAPYLSSVPARTDVRSVFAGLRPLVDMSAGKATAGLSREHFVEVSPGGLITITGGKWTTYRRMAEDAVDAAEDRAGLEKRRCITAHLRVHGASDDPAADAYGTERGAVDSLPGAGRPIGEGLTLTEAEVRYAVRSELARSVEDVLARRHRGLFLDARLARAAAPAVARILAAELGRDESWCEAQVGRFSELARAYLPVSRPEPAPP